MANRNKKPSKLYVSNALDSMDELEDNMDRAATMIGQKLGNDQSDSVSHDILVAMV